MTSVCKVSMYLERPKAPRIYKPSTLVACSTYMDKESLYGSRKITSETGSFEFRESDVNTRLAGRAIELLPKIKYTV